jgi:hypothetical protein
MPASWTCERCGVVASWATGSGSPTFPTAWAEEEGAAYCLACRRERAGEAGLATAPADTTAEDRVRIRLWALIEFEIERDPDRPNGAIARAVRSSVPAVIKARQRLGSRAAL